ncbi:unnamed protein product, partial [Symbiodinium sp. KB8]
MVPIQGSVLRDLGTVVHRSWEFVKVANVLHLEFAYVGRHRLCTREHQQMRLMYELAGYQGTMPAESRHVGTGVQQSQEKHRQDAIVTLHALPRTKEEALQLLKATGTEEKPLMILCRLEENTYRAVHHVRRLADQLDVHP